MRIKIAKLYISPVVFHGYVEIKKDFGLFCLVFALMGVESRAMNEVSIIPILDNFST